MFGFILRLFGIEPVPDARDHETPRSLDHDMRDQADRRGVVWRPDPPRPVAVPTPTPTIASPAFRPGQILRGRCFVIDGDTIIIDGTHIRLAGIDAPELDDPYGKSAKFAMARLCKGQTVTAEVCEGVTYDRIVAKCLLSDGTDLSAELVKQGLALDWAKFSEGAYRHLEPDGVRKKLWRVAAKHQGRLKMKAN